MISNVRIAKWVTRGTTTKAENVVVLYNDDAWALVKWPSVTYNGTYVSPWVTQQDLYGLNDSYGTSGEVVWDCARDVDGPMNSKNLKLLVKQRRLNPDFICTPPPKRDVPSREKVRQAIQRVKKAKERTVKLETGAVKVCLRVRGVEDWMGEGCEEVLEAARIVGEIDEIGLMYVVLMYDSLIDLMEFFKTDREILLDSLELHVSV